MVSLLKNTFLKKSGPKTLVDQFYYPDLGTGLIYESIKKVIEKDNIVLLGTEPIKVTHLDNKIQEVVLSNSKSYKTEYLVSSVPITNFINLLYPGPSQEVIDTAKKVRYRSQVYLFLTINKPHISKDQWIYFPDKEIPFGRFSEMKNFSSKMSPKNKTSLFIEFFCWRNDNIWNKSKEELFELAIQWLEKLGFVKREWVIDIFHIKQAYAYPVYDLEYKKNIDILKNYLDKFSNLLYIGRPGRFKYTNQDHSLEMGILAARSIIESRRLDIEDVGAEKEYFEKGYVK